MGERIDVSSKDDRFFVKRIHELSAAAYTRGMITFSDFLDQRQISILSNETGQLDSPFSLYGGYDGAERLMAAFMGRELYEGEEMAYPISFVRIEPVGEKFTGGFGHRDVLGSVLGLGIERRLTGDIITRPFCGIFCEEQIADFIAENLTQVRRTRVECAVVSPSEFEYEPVFEERNISVASNRLDAVIAAACHVSRGEAEKLVEKELVFVNSRLVGRTHSLDEGDVVTVRGTGKFRLERWTGESKKGKQRAMVLWYSS